MASKRRSFSFLNSKQYLWVVCSVFIFFWLTRGLQDCRFFRTGSILWYYQIFEAGFWKSRQDGSKRSIYQIKKTSTREVSSFVWFEIVWGLCFKMWRNLETLIVLLKTEKVCLSPKVTVGINQLLRESLFLFSNRFSPFHQARKGRHCRIRDWIWILN